VIVLNDVTEVARLDEMRTELIGVASHELKTPLTALRMNLMLLGEEDQHLCQRNREMLSAALAGSEELESTIDELLDMTRIEAGQLRLDLAPVDLGAILGRVQARLQPRFDDARVAYRLTADDGPAIAQGDAARLTSVFTNILVNALKYSPQGGTVTVSITSGAFTPAGAVSRQIARKIPAEMLQVAVTDAGPGIPVECREKVFEKFFRVEHQRGDSVDGVRGTGIGLYLCREIVRAHGGAIWCEAGDAGVGTRVAMRVPRAGSA
jgi:NtrC-family two-component system sensor histidine kinase KinB